jgi:MFS family permease
MMIASRFLQGSFGALLIPQGMAIMARSFPRKMLSKAFALFGPVISISTITGPVFAGFLINANLFNLGWRPIFLINTFIGILGFIIAYKVLPRYSGNKSIILDSIGSGLLGGAMLFSLDGIIEGEAKAWDNISILMLILGAFLFILFIWRQIKANNPIIRPSLFKNRGFRSGLILGLVFFAVVSGLNYIISLFLQLGLGASPLEASLKLAPLSLGIVLSSIITHKIIEHLGRKIILYGLITTVVGVTFLFLSMNKIIELNFWPFYVSVFIIGIGLGFCFGTLYDFAIGDVDTEEAGSASGSLSAIQQLSGSIGIAIITSMFFSFKNSVSMLFAMRQSLMIILILLGLCIPIVRLLPLKTRQVEH